MSRPPRFFRVVGSYWLSAWPRAAAEGTVAEVDGVVTAGSPWGAANVVGHLVVFGEERAPRQPWDLEIFDERGTLILRYVEGVPKERE